MRIICLNGWGGTLHEAVRAYLAREAPDVLCLQEVVHTPATSKEWLDYRDGDHVLPQRANFFRDVSEALPEHVAIFCPAAQGILWDGEETVPSQWGLATFVHRRFPIIGQMQGFVHKGFSPDGYGEHPRSRSAHVIRLHDFDRGWSITIAHMHGLRDLNGKIDTPERLEQARRLVGLVQAVAEPGDRLVVCGDFNVEPGSQTFGILAGLDLEDLVVGRGHTDTRTSHYKKPGRYADYMLVNEAVEVLAFEVVQQPEVSDHRPLLLEV
ncbi:endonuclease/exonuclease/phosphatase family protein [Bosea sp. (in: a-proteobacteria)]|uniref:endonuclease/exonuclease/phosphatase family protein n=1 Tax=Bosea sp. (in: a-proteobacteria) TaxID=1871050 RepID=UPI002DDCD85C|nr:endonuclease/exonuclease/phosphatase family protein [Bosea sp. (in: a-proteobacteria)]HEV2511809.1 endonuclease/exonuclease/phosphatase family protein [Bosea sp. (in: a-proteobacteria)]